MVFEYFEKTLADELEEKNNNSKRYSEEDLWAMMVGLYSALSVC